MWELPVLKQWLNTKGRENRRTAPWTDELEADCSQYYLQAYMAHFMSTGIRDAYASIPSVNMLDDHDLWDGYGSYPEYLSTSHVFQNLSRIGYRFYFLFQHHTTLARTAHDGFVVGSEGRSHSLVRSLGREVSLVCVDARSERTRTQILSQASWDILFAELDRLPASVRHLAVVTGVPVVYPRMGAADTFLSNLGTVKQSVNKGFNGLANGLGTGLGRVMGSGVEASFQRSVKDLKTGVGKTGLMKGILNQFGEPDLTDDLIGK